MTDARTGQDRERTRGRSGMIRGAVDIARLLALKRPAEGPGAADA